MSYIYKQRQKETPGHNPQMMQTPMHYHGNERYVSAQQLAVPGPQGAQVATSQVPVNYMERQLVGMPTHGEGQLHGKMGGGTSDSRMSMDARRMAYHGMAYTNSPAHSSRVPTMMVPSEHHPDRAPLATEHAMQKTEKPHQQMGNQPFCNSARWRIPTYEMQPSALPHGIHHGGSVDYRREAPHAVHSTMPGSMPIAMQGAAQGAMQGSMYGSMPARVPGPMPMAMAASNASAQAALRGPLQGSHQPPGGYNFEGHNPMIGQYLRGYLDGQRSSSSTGEYRLADFYLRMDKKGKRRRRTKEKGQKTERTKQEALTKRSLSAFWSTFLGERVMLVKRAELDQPVLRRGRFVERKSSSSKHNVGVLCDCCNESFTIYGWADHCDFCYIRGPRQHLRLEKNGKRLCDAVAEMQEEQKKREGAKEAPPASDEPEKTDEDAGADSTPPTADAAAKVLKESGEDEPQANAEPPTKKAKGDEKK